MNFWEPSSLLTILANGMMALRMLMAVLMLVRVRRLLQLAHAGRIDVDVMCPRVEIAPSCHTCRCLLVHSMGTHSIVACPIFQCASSRKTAVLPPSHSFDRARCAAAEASA